MKSWKIWIALVVTTVMAAAGIYIAYVWWLAEPIIAAPGTHVVRVRRGPLVATMKAVGAVAAPPEVALNFGIGGWIKELKVAEGQVVQAGDTLAELDTDGLMLQVAQAEAVLALSQAQSARAKVGATEAEVASAEASLVSAQANYEQVKAGPLATDLAAAEAALKSGEASYAQLLVGPSEDEITVAAANLDKANVALRAAQTEYDKYAWRQGFEASPQAAALQQVTIDYQQALAAYNVAMTGPTSDRLVEAQAQIAQARAQAEKVRAGSTTAELMAAAALVAQAHARVDNLKNSPIPEELAIAQAQVHQAEIALEQARRQLPYATLIAPKPGTVVAIGANVGQSVAPTTQVVILADLSRLEVEVGINEVDIGKVEEGQKATVLLDSFPDYYLDGQVSEIAPLPTVVAGIVNYPVFIELNDYDLIVRPGMAAQVDFITAEKPDALLVPRAGLRLREGEWVVWVLRNGRPVGVEVDVGQRVGREVEVFGGVAEGEEVVIGSITPSTGQRSNRLLPWSTARRAD